MIVKLSKDCHFLHRAPWVVYCARAPNSSLFVFVLALLSFPLFLVKQVIVMVPTLAPSGEESPPIARAAYPGSYHHSGASPYYASAAASTISSAVAGGSHDPRDYQMPPPPHHAAYASHWGAAAATGYGGRPPQPPTGFQQHLPPPGVRLPPHHIATRPPGLGELHGSHMPPGSQH